MTTNAEAVEPVAVMIEDLYFMSIISSAAGKVGVPVRFLRRGEAVPDSTPLLLVDVQFPGDWEADVRRFVDQGGQTLAFGPHMDTETRKRARDAGCARVLAKSKFAREVGSILQDARAAGNNSPAPVWAN